MELSSESVSGEDARILLSLIDHARFARIYFSRSVLTRYSKRYLSKFVIPARDLIPGEQYNLAIRFHTSELLLTVMVQKTLYLQVTTCLFPQANDLILKELLFMQKPELLRLEVFLHGLISSETVPYTFSKPLLSVIHVVEDIDAYTESLKKVEPTCPFVSLTSLVESSLKPSTSQVAYPCRPSRTPRWNSLFEFNMNEVHSCITPASIESVSSH